MDFTNSQVIKLKARVKELEDANSHLEKELVDALKDPFTKYEKKEPSENPKKRGAPFGHEGHFRKKPDKIDKTVDVYLENCPHCGGEDISPCNHTTEHIQEDIEDGQIKTTCFVHCFYWCPECKDTVHGWGENEIPNAFIGPETRALATFLRHQIKISYGDIPRVFKHFSKLVLAASSVVGFDNKFFDKGKPLYDALKATLPESNYIHVDETGWKRDWLWIFTNSDIAFFHIDTSRGSQVVIDHLGNNYKGILISDFYSAYRSKIDAFAKQKCCTHLLRDIKKLLEEDLAKHPDADVFLSAVKKLIQDAIDFHDKYPELSPEAWRSGKHDIMLQFRVLLKNKALSQHEADNIRKRLITFKNELFVFLKYPAVPPTNNPAEQGLRNSVLFRKITFGNMTDQG